MKYLPDKEATVERIAELRASVEMARYELGAAVQVARQYGLTWEDLGAGLGMTKQGASQYVKRLPEPSFIDDAEHERLCRLIDVGDRLPRYEVRRVVSGNRHQGYRYEPVSRHLRAYVAARVLAELPAENGRREAGAVWRVAPDGRAEKLTAEELRSTVKMERIRRETVRTVETDEETPF